MAGTVSAGVCAASSAGQTWMLGDICSIARPSKTPAVRAQHAEGDATANRTATRAPSCFGAMPADVIGRRSWRC